MHQAGHAWLIAGHPGELVLILPAVAVVSFYLTFRYWSLARSVADTALARVRSAPHGYVELYGRAEFAADTKQRNAPLTGRSCVWWSFTIAEKSGRSWAIVDRGTSAEAFMLHDDTGACLVDPDGALIRPSSRNVWYGSESWPSAPYSTGGLLGGRYRYTELRIEEHDGVCVLGDCATVGGLADGGLETDIAALLHLWKDDQATLLKRFDRDGDGTLNASEWDQAREAARSQVLSQRAQMPTVKQMTKPRDGRTYLIAASDPAHVAQRYRWQAAAGLGCFFISVILIARLYL
jgi:hypothetical protein